ncbi:hypothetical protein GWI72_04900 [Microvirga tunisiensis]|uniref:Uncharacterized protein n=2 Tax=Pannonibacter tanglangensis TaxID=2750084 RepID=A0ABW9ZK30_9HYPH|nr:MULTISPECIES: hypothetical protein [unclassified Pannonibacter]NBN63966.1 hypothetical protein [Pannonibacter sp. XCT-34]NBN77603.1 hypothetical protein [Pannonibacter sp. XCT-53]
MKKSFVSPFGTPAVRLLVLLTAAVGFLVGLTVALGVWCVFSPTSLALVVLARLDVGAEGLDDWQVQAVAGILILLFALWLQALAALKDLVETSLDPGHVPISLLRFSYRRALQFSVAGVVWSVVAQMPLAALLTDDDRFLLMRFGELTLLSVLLFAFAVLSFRLVLASRRETRAAAASRSLSL